MTDLYDRFAILELYEEWEASTRSSILKQFEEESKTWEKESVPRRSNNDDLFQDVEVPTFLDVYSICTQGRHSLEGNKKLSKHSKQKSKRKVLPKKSRRRRSKEKVKFPKGRKTTALKSITLKNSSSSSHRKRGKGKGSSLVTNANNFQLSDVAKTDVNFKITDVVKTDRIVCSSVGPTKQTTSSPPISQTPGLSFKYNTAFKLPVSSNCNRGSKLSDKNGIPLIFRMNEACKQKVGNSSGIHSFLFPIVPKGPSAPQLAMQIVQALAWDTVRRVRRSGYAEGCDIVLIKPQGMPEAPSLLAMQNCKGDLNIPCDSLSNQTALSQILGLLHKSVTGAGAAK